MNGYLFQEHLQEQISQLAMMILQNHLSIGNGITWKMSWIKWPSDISVGLLIGANCTKALEPIEILQSRNGGPYAFKTWLGWYVIGPVNRTKYHATR